MNIEMNVDMVNIAKNLSTTQKQVSDKSFSNILSRDAKTSSNNKQNNDFQNEINQVNSDFQNEVNQVNEVARCMNNDKSRSKVPDIKNIDDNKNINVNANKNIAVNLNNQKSVIESILSSNNDVKVNLSDKSLSNVEDTSNNKEMFEVESSIINQDGKLLKVDSSIIKQIEALVKDKINDLDEKDVNDAEAILLSMIQSLFINNSEQVMESDDQGKVNNIFEMLVNNLGNDKKVLDVQVNNYSNMTKETSNDFINELVNLLETNNVSISDEELNQVIDKINNFAELIKEQPKVLNVDNIKEINNVDSKEIDNTEVVNELVNTINEESNNEEVNIKESIIEEISFTNSKEDVNKTNKEVISKTSDYVKTEETKTSNLENNNESSLLNQDEADKQFDKEDKLLKSILNDGNDNSNIINRFTQLSSNSTNNINASKENVVVAYTTKETIKEDIIKELRYMNSNGVKDLLVRINPKELGEIAIKIVQEDGHMKAILKASSKETYALLSQNSDQMKEQLKNSGIKIQNVDISLYEEDTTYFKGEGFSNQNFSNRHNNSSNSTSTKNDVIINDDDFEEDSIIEDLNNLNILV